MDDNIKLEVKREINRIVDMMVQMDALRNGISELKKDIKTEYGIPVATITKIATLIRKQNLDEEDQKWQEIKEYVELCS
jgi:hypothetical protein